MKRGDLIYCNNNYFIFKKGVFYIFDSMVDDKIGIKLKDVDPAGRWSLNLIDYQDNFLSLNQLRKHKLLKLQFDIMNRKEFLKRANAIFSKSNDYFGEIIVDVKLQVYDDAGIEVCLLCQLDMGTTEAAIDIESGHVNFARSGWNFISDEMGSWSYSAIEKYRWEGITTFDIPFN